MSTLVPFPRKPLRTAVLDFVAASGPRPTAGVGPEEQEFIDALRRIVAPTRADALWERYRGPIPDPQARVFGRYAD